MSHIRIAVLGADQLDADHQNALDALAEHGAITTFAETSTDPTESLEALRQAKSLGAIEAVIIAGSRQDLAKLAAGSLGLGLPTYCAHPATANIEDMVAIRRAEQGARQTPLQFALNARQHDSVATALSKAESGEYGRLLALRAVCGLSSPGSAQGGVLDGIGMEMVDLIQAFTGPVQDIEAFSDQAMMSAGHRETNILSILRTHSGIMASLHASTTQWRETFRVELGFERGYLWLEGLNRAAHSFGQEVLVYARSNGPESLHETVVRFADSNGVQSGLTAFLNRVQSHDQPATGTSQQAFDALNTVERIYAADPLMAFIEERQAS